MPKSCSLRASMPIRTGLMILTGVWDRWANRSHTPGNHQRLQLPADSQVQLQDRRLYRVMLLVKRNLTPSVRVVGRSWRRRRRSAAQVHDFDVRREENPPSAGADGSAEVDVLRVHEEPLVESADGVGVRPPYEKAGGAHPVRRLPLAREPLHSTRSHEALLPELVERADHPAEGQLRAAAAVNQARPDHGHAWIAIEFRDETVNRTGRDD